MEYHIETLEFNKLYKAKKFCKDLWTPLTDHSVEGKFVNLYDGSSPEFLPMLKGQPNGNRDQNCLNMFMSFFPTPYTDIECSLKYFSVCQLTKSTLLQLRGLCQNSNLDTIYVPLNRDHAVMFSGWRGLMYTMITS